MSVRRPDIDHPAFRRPGEGVVGRVAGEIGVAADLPAVVNSSAVLESPPSVPRSVIPVPAFQINACCFAMASGANIRVQQVIASSCLVFIFFEIS